MSEQWQFRRGTWAVASVSTPAEGEVWFITDTVSLVLGDGSTVGGIPWGPGTGDYRFTGRATVDPGWLLSDARTIGSASSAADLRGSQYQALFLHLWDNYSPTAAPVVGGRGATAAADWAANKAITLPDRRGRTGVGANGANPLTSRAVGEIWGAEDHTLIRAELPNETLDVTATRKFGSNQGSGTGLSQDNGNTSAGTLQTEPMGSGQAHNNEQPSIGEYVWIKL